MAGHRAEGEGEGGGALGRGGAWDFLRSSPLPGASLSRGMKGNGTRHRSLESAHRGSGTRESSAIVWRSLPFLPGDSGEHAGDSRRSPCPAHFQRGGFHRKAPNGVKCPSRRRARSMGAYVPRAPF